MLLIFFGPRPRRVESGESLIRLEIKGKEESIEEKQDQEIRKSINDRGLIDVYSLENDIISSLKFNSKKYFSSQYMNNIFNIPSTFFTYISM